MRLQHAMSAIIALPNFLASKGIEVNQVSQIIVEPQNSTSHPVQVLLFGADEIRKIGHHEAKRILHDDGFSMCYTAYNDCVQFVAYEHCMTSMMLPF